MMSRLLLVPSLMFALATAQCLAADPEAKPFIGTWTGKEDRQLGLPAPMLKIQKDGSGQYFLTDRNKPLYEFTWKMGEDQLQATATDGDRFFAGIIRPDGKIMWKAVKLRPGVRTNALEFEKVPSDF
jgi:hypothetical protein